MGGAESDVLQDLTLITQEAAKLGLQLNQYKSELICSESAGKSLLQFSPNLSRVSCEEVMLIGTAIGPIRSINVAILDKVDVLKTKTTLP